MAIIVSKSRILTKDELNILDQASEILATLHPPTSGAIDAIIRQSQEVPLILRLGQPDFDDFLEDAVTNLTAQDIKKFEHYVFLIGFMQSQGKSADILPTKPEDAEAWKRFFSEDGMVHLDVDSAVYSDLIDRLKGAKAHLGVEVKLEHESKKRSRSDTKKVDKPVAKVAKPDLKIRCGNESE